MTNTQQSTTIERYYSGLMAQMSAIVKLSQCDSLDELTEEDFDELGTERDLLSEQYPNDCASEFANAMVYAVERLAVVEDDDTVGELRSVELLLGGGGPTITLTAEIRDDGVRDFTLWHSWGSDIGSEASMRSQSHEARETVESFLHTLGALIN